MSDLSLIWLSTGATVAATVVAFIALALWSAGEPVTWSIVPGLARGVSAWAHRRTEPDPMRFLSPRAEEPGSPIDLGGLPLTSFVQAPGEPEAWIAVPADPTAVADAEIVDLGTRRIQGG